MKKILITTGGTGGHVIPAEIIGEHLKDVFNINFSSDIRGYKYLKNKNFKIFIIDTPKLNLNLLFPFKLLKIFYLILRSIIYLKKEKVDKIISTGGYMSLPVCISAKILGIEIFLLEPNLTLGRANKFFLNFSKKILCYSKNLINFPSKFNNKIKLINPLVSKDFYELKKVEEMKSNFCILISGGSQGAKIFDGIIKESIVELANEYSLKVIQQTNIKNIENLKNFYNMNKIENKIFDFEKNFINLINEADLCITRAGATSLAEISIMNKPFIAIPLPTAKDNHQMENARFYENMGVCWVISQNEMSKQKMTEILLSILKDKSDYNKKKSNLKKLNYQNTWNDVNQNLKNIINEN